MPPDRTYLAVRRQLGGMGCARYEVGIRSAVTGQMIIQPYSQNQVLDAVGFLKSKNAAGCDIYIRPEGSLGLILLDDVSRGAIARMKGEGATPSCVIETSPDNFQVWIRVSRDPIPKEQATHIARTLTQTYDADPSSADYRHFGRLAGFTNKKPLYVDLYGKAPYVLAHECKPVLAPIGQEMLLKASISPVKPSSVVQTTQTTITSPQAFYEAQMGFYEGRYQSRLDVSRADWAIVGKMLLQGYSDTEITDTLTACSPALQSRKAGHVEDYISRTLAKQRTNLGL